MKALHQSLGDTIEANRDRLAMAIIAAHWAEDPKLEARYDATERAKCLQDVKYHLAYLAQAIAANSPPLFMEYVQWVAVLFEGLHIPVQDFAVSLRITAGVLRRELGAEAGEVVEPYVEAALAQLAHTPATIPSFVRPDRPLAPLARAYLDALLEGERSHASRLILDAVEKGTGVKDIYLQVFQPAQREIGRLWQMNQISVAQEHYCTATTQLVMSQLYPHVFAGEKSGRRMIAACVGDELHEIGLRMVADFFEMEGWDTTYLGSNTPTGSIVHMLAEHHADLLAISATMTFHVGTVAELIDQVRASDRVNQTTILVGGYPFNVAPQLWQQVGADGFASDAQQAIATANALVEGGA